MPIAVDQPIPDFTAPATGGEITLSKLRGKKVVLYFYPKDNTPGCTTEGLQFRDLYPKFKKAGAEILGVSRDSLRSHDNFKAKLELPFPLISDPEETLVCALRRHEIEENVWQRSAWDRTLHVPDRRRRRAAPGVAWRESAGHVDDILEAVQAL